MRRVTLTVFFCLAACGGTDMVNSSPSRGSGPADRQAYLLSPEALAIIASLTGTASDAAIHACLSSWVSDDGPGSPSEGPMEKPNASSFRQYLIQCLADSKTPDARKAADNPAALRAAEGDLRGFAARSQ
jgi:hypothetical protein